MQNECLLIMLASPLAPLPSWLNLAIHQTQPVLETVFVSPSLVLQTSGSSYSRKMDASNTKRMLMNQTVAQKLITTAEGQVGALQTPGPAGPSDSGTRKELI